MRASSLGIVTIVGDAGQKRLLFVVLLWMVWLVLFDVVKRVLSIIEQKFLLHHLNGIGDGGNTGRHRQASMDIEREKRENHNQTLFIHSKAKKKKDPSRMRVNMRPLTAQNLIYFPRAQGEREHWQNMPSNYTKWQIDFDKSMHMYVWMQRERVRQEMKPQRSGELRLMTYIASTGKS